jgi:hypothetical protein
VDAGLTRKRLAQTQFWPEFRYFDWIAPDTAASRSASSKTMNGALPPSSIETRFIVAAAAAVSCLPTGVEPVKVILRTSGFSVSSAPISRAAPCHHVEDAGRHPASSARRAQAIAE